MHNDDLFDFPCSWTFRAFAVELNEGIRLYDTESNNSLIDKIQHLEKEIDTLKSNRIATPRLMVVQVPPKKKVAKIARKGVPL